MAERPSQHPLSRHSIEKLSELKNEPGWMTDLRLSAWERYRQAAPSAQLQGLALERLEAFAAPRQRSVPSEDWPQDLPHTLEERGDEEGTIIQRDAATLSRALTKDAVKRGVIYSELDAAVRTAPELVRPYFARQLRGGDALAALHTAFWNGGSFLYVPSHVDLHLPFHTCFWMSQSGLAAFPHTLIHVGPGSTVFFIDEYLSKHWPEPSLAVPITEIQASEKARVHYIHIQNWGANVYHVAREVSQVAASAQLFSLAAALGGQASGVSVRLETTAGNLRRVSSASAGPVDSAKCEALTRRGLSWAEARYEAASEFFDPILAELPNPPLREKLRHYVVGKVIGERPPVTLHRTAELHPEVRL